MDLQTTQPLSWQALAAAHGLHTSRPKQHQRERRAHRTPRVRHGLMDNRIADLMQRQCVDGERNNHLTVLAGTLLASGVSLDEALHMCHQWNANNPEPLDDERIESTVESILRTDQANHPERYPELIVHTPLFQPDEGKIDRFLSTPPPPREWLLKDLVVLGKVAAVVAPGGHSKSQWLLQVAVGVATGLPVAEYWEIGTQGRVLVYFAEDDHDEIHRRTYQIHQHLKLQGNQSHEQQMVDRLRLHSTVGMDTLLTRTGSSGEVERTTIIDRICAEAKLIDDLKLIIIDPISRFRGGEENSNEDATRFVEALETIAQRTGATVMVSHHTNKGSYQADGDPSQGAARGASALTDGLRWQMNLGRPSQKQLDSIGISNQHAGRYVTATVTKTNYSAFPEPVILERLDGGYLSAVSASSAQQAQQTQAIMRVLQVIANQPRALTARQLERQFAGATHTLQMSVQSLRTTLQAAAARGFLTLEHRKPLALTGPALQLLQAADQRATATRRDATPPRKKRSKNQ